MYGTVLVEGKQIEVVHRSSCFKTMIVYDAHPVCMLESLSVWWAVA